MLKLIVERGEGRGGRADSGELRGESGEPFDGACPELSRGAQGKRRVERGEGRGERADSGELRADS